MSLRLMEYTAAPARDEASLWTEPDQEEGVTLVASLYNAYRAAKAALPEKQRIQRSLAADATLTATQRARVDAWGVQLSVVSGLLAAGGPAIETVMEWYISVFGQPE